MFKKIILFYIIVLLLFINCSPTSNDQSYDWGIPWDEIDGTKWYVLDGNGRAINEFRFYKDSVVVVVDHFSERSNDTGFVQERIIHLGKVMDKDRIISQIDNEKLDGVYQATDLQWKKYVPGRYDPCTWTPLYSYSTYQWWYIYDIKEDTLQVGNAPYYYTLTKTPPITVIYPEGFVPTLCEEGVEIRRNTL